MREIVHYGFNQTILHPAVIVIMILMAILIFSLSRKWAIVPFIFVILYIPEIQRIVIGGFDFDMIRIMIILGFIRVYIRAEYHALKINTIDKAMIWFVVLSIITYTILLQTTGAFANRLGFAFTTLGCYFLIRIFVINIDDIYNTVRIMAIMSIPLACEMLMEDYIGRNIFGIFDPNIEIPMTRNGAIRAQASFSHPILAGSYGAALLPLMIGLWWYNNRYKFIVFSGIIASILITLTSSSSGPILAYLVSIAGLLMWLFRKYMRIIRWGTIGGIIFLHLVMKAPVWALIGRASAVSGSTGSHRFMLIDQAIRRFPEWWLFGSTSMASWGWGLQDITNQYVRIGVNGGIFTLILFVLIIVFCFQSIGRAVKSTEGETTLQKSIWAIGVCIFSQVVSFIGVSYFGNIIVIWYLSIAMCATIRGLDFEVSEQ